MTVDDNAPPLSKIFSATKPSQSKTNINIYQDETDQITNERKENGDKHHKNYQTPDGGYGWIVVFASFLSHVIIGCLDRSDGIFFLEFQKRFGLNAQLASWPGALLSALRLCFGPVATLVCNRYSVRTACAIGSILNFIGLLLNSHAQSFYILFLSHFIVQGVGQGLIYSPGLFLVGAYFDKRRSLAAGLSTSGVGVGTFLLLPLSQKLFEEYGYRGAFMCIAASALNLSVCAMLYRPLNLYFKLTRNKDQKNTKYSHDHESEVFVNNIEQPSTNNLDFSKETGNFKQKNGIEHFSVENTDSHFVNRNFQKNMNIVRTRVKDWCITSLKICFPADTYMKSKCSNKRQLFHFHLLKNPPFLLCCVSIMLFTVASKSTFTFIPAQVESLGHSGSNSAMALSVAGILDMIGRLSFGFLLDLKGFKAHRLVVYTVLIFLIATVSFVMPRLEDYWSICVICGIYGLLYGGFVSQKSVIIVDILGADNITNSFGLLICFQGIGMMIGPPVSGALRDMTRSFHLAFDLGGTLMLCAGCLMVASNVFFRRYTTL